MRKWSKNRAPFQSYTVPPPTSILKLIAPIIRSRLAFTRLFKFRSKPK